MKEMEKIREAKRSDKIGSCSKSKKERWKKTFLLPGQFPDFPSTEYQVTIIIIIIIMSLPNLFHHFDNQPWNLTRRNFSRRVIVG